VTLEKIAVKNRDLRVDAETYRDYNMWKQTEFIMNEKTVDKNHPLYILGMCIGVFVLAFCAGCGWMTALSLFN